MNVKSFEKKEKSTAQLVVEATAEEFEQAVAKAYLKDRGRIMVPGFRKGKAPRKIIENMYGTSVFYETALDILIPDALNYAMEQEKVDLVGTPSVMDMEFGEGEDKTVTLTFLVSVYPSLELGEYKGIKAVKPVAEVTEADIDAEVEAARKKNTRFQAVDRPAANGDTANIDYKGCVNGVAFEGGTDSDYDLVLGSGNFIPGFEEQVVGMTAGEEKDINVTFPEQYAPQLAGKDAVFTVKVNEVREAILPDLDDEFAKDVSEFDTLAEYRDSIKEMLIKRKESAAQGEFETAVMNALIDNFKGDIPDVMIEERVNYTVNDYERNFKAQGIDFSKYLEMIGTTMTQYKNDMRASAERQIRSDLIFERIAKEEQFEITDEDMEAEYAEIAAQYDVDVDTVKKSLNADMVKNNINMKKAQKLVFDNAVAEKPKAKRTSKPRKKTVKADDAAAAEETPAETPAETEAPADAE